jgi:sporulation protein YlmC with PRC-barrel domain
LVSVSKLNGEKVIGANAYKPGEITGTDVDTGKGQITHLHVGLTDEATRELGFKKPLSGSVIVCLPIDIIQATGDVISLNKSVTELRNIVQPKKHR